MTLTPVPGIPRDSKPAVKVILVGNSGVGKTCLISAFQKLGFNRFSESTVAPSFVCKQVQRSDGSLNILQIWDTAGQERFSSISQFFFREARIALLCFDPTDPSSITGLIDWVKRVQAEVPDCKLLGVMTKADKYATKEELQSTFEEAKAELGGLPMEEWFITSAVTRQGVDELFQLAADQRVDGFETHVKAQVVTEAKTGCC
jgi:small GTP-binding protein